MNHAIFWKNILVFFVSLILFDFIAGNVLEHFYFTQKKGKLYNITVALEKQTSEVLIFGSSRAMHHYNPHIITDSLGLSCFNAGYDSEGILYANAMLDAILERYIPKVIILDVLPVEFSESTVSYDLLYLLNPYVKKHPVLWNTLSLKSRFEKIKHLSSIYPYNSMLARIIIGNLSIKTKDESDSGFTALNGIWNGELKPTIFSEKSLDPNKLNVFNAFCQKCLKNKIKLYVVISPLYQLVENESSTEKYLNSAQAKYNFYLINLSKSKNYLTNKYWKDEEHLNAKGADKFSKDIAYRIFNSNR